MLNKLFLSLFDFEFKFRLNNPGEKNSEIPEIFRKSVISAPTKNKAVTREKKTLIRNKACLFAK